MPIETDCLRTYFIETYGCQMNLYDTELIHSILEKAGYITAKEPAEAHILMMNTCSVRENANNKIKARVHELRRMGIDPVIGILGCMATNLKETLLNDPHLKLDFVVGPDSYKQLPDILEQRIKHNQKSMDVNLSEMETYDDIEPVRKKGVNAWLAIMRGCNNFCSYCVVPYTRGRERSRKAEDILAEVRTLVKEGFCQVTLLGQNVNSYSADGIDFADLICKIADIDNIKRIRFASPHPKDFPEKLIDAIRDRSNICNHIHLPVQAGNSRVLQMMNRHYTKEDYLALVDRIRSKIPDIAITTDIIVGFPTETDAEFQDTVDVFRKVAFDSAFIFKYSERPHTVAARHYPDDIDDIIKTERIVQLNQIQKEISLEKNQALIGQTLPVLIEEQGTKKSKTDFQGRTDSNKIVIFSNSNSPLGSIVSVKIVEATAHILKGVI